MTLNSLAYIELSDIKFIRKSHSMRCLPEVRIKGPMELMDCCDVFGISDRSYVT